MGPFMDLQWEIEKRSLSSGGWPSGNGRSAGIETTCLALMALHDRQVTARDKAIDLLLRTQNADGSWPAFEGDDPEGCWVTALAIVTLRFLHRRPPESMRRSSGSSTIKVVKGTGFGGGNSEHSIAASSSTRTNTAGRGFRTPSVGSFQQRFQSSH